MSNTIFGKKKILLFELKIGQNNEKVQKIMDQYIFPNANLVDYIRQACINLQNHPNDNDVLNFLKQTMKNLKNDISIFVLNELLTAIISCFSYNSKFFTSFFPHLFKRSRLNSNFIIINTFIISDYIFTQSQLPISDYQSFIDDELTEISSQIWQSDDIPLEIFGHKISPFFKKDLIISLLLTSTLIDKLFLSTFSYLFQHDLLLENPKFALLLQNYSKNCTIHILTQNEASNDNINEYIKQNGDYPLANLNDPALSLIASASIFIKSKEKKKIKGLKKETILQFLAVLIIIAKKCQIQEKVKFSAKPILDLIIETVKDLKLNTLSVLNTSIDFIIENYFYINTTLSIPFDFIFEMFDIILQQIKENEYKANALIFFEAIFDLSNKIIENDCRDQIKNFFNKKFQKIFELMFNDKYLVEINKNYKFKQIKFNLESIDQEKFVLSFFFSTISSLTNFVYNENIHSIFSFLHNFCSNVSKKTFDEISDKLWEYIKLKSDKKDWDEVLLISQFMLNNKLNFDIEKAKSLFPPTVKNILFGNDQKAIETIDDLLDNILNDTHLEDNNEVFNILFEKMIQNQELLLIYLNYMFAKNSSSSTFYINDFLQFFIDEYEKYNDTFIIACKKMFVFTPLNGLFTPKLNYKIENLEMTSSFGFDIIDKLFETIKIKDNNYQAFICLMNIACCFPILFTKDIKRVLDSVYQTFDHILILFDDKLDDNDLLLIKTTFSALHFLASTFLSSTILDYFYDWIFSNILKLSDGQILCSFIILNMLNKSENIEIASLIYILKYDFIEISIKLLKREIKNGSFENCYKENIYGFIGSTYLRLSKLDIYQLIQISELMKIQNPIVYFYNTILFKSPEVYKFLIKIVKLDYQSQLGKFAEKLTRDNTFWLSYDFNMRKIRMPDLEVYTNFIEQMDKDESLLTYKDLKIVQGPLSLKMAKYLIIQPNWFYNDILYSQNVNFTKERIDYYNNAVDYLNKLRENGNKHLDDIDEINIDFIPKNEYILPQYCRDNLIKTVVSDICSFSLNNQCIFAMSYLLNAYTLNNEALKKVLLIISQTFNDIYEKCICFASSSNLKAMYNLIKALSSLTNKKELDRIFFEVCGNNLINITLSPELRKDPNMLKKVTKLLLKFDELPIRSVQLIPFIILLRDEDFISESTLFYKKFSDDQLQCVNKIILSAFDQEINNEKRFSIVMSQISIFPSIVKMRKSKAYSILKGLLKKLETQKKDKIINLTGLLLNGLAPNHIDINSYSSKEDKISKIPSFVKDTSPEFWNFFEKHMDPILKIVTEKPSLIYKFEFLLDYPELVSFKSRILFFREKMKSKINKQSSLVLNIDPDDILTTSYRNIIGKTPKDLLKKITVVFIGTNAIDLGGPRREWFTKLAKEIFSPNYALFDCSKSSCYQPSSVSYVHEDYLQQFWFAGVFIARALIEGQCIDAHLTTAFCKQILQRNTDLKDLQDVDEELFNSLNWMLDNDVDSLDLYFEAEFEEFGVHKTIPLKENGSEIKVTNDNKREFVHLKSQFTLSKKIEKQLNAFCDGFYSLIQLKEIRFFTPYELDLLICGVPEINVEDFIKNCTFGISYSRKNPVIIRFFKIIRNWDNEKLVKLFCFITGSSRIPANGFKEFCEITGYPLKIETGDINGLPKAHTCFNTIDLPPYQSEDEMSSKILFAIQECDTFGMT